MPLPESHPDYWTETLQFTPTVHRDVYPALDPREQRLQHIAKGKIVIVTGAGSGFGEGACHQWVTAGVEGIVLCGRSTSALDRVAESIKHDGSVSKVLVFPCDVSSPEDVDALFKEAELNLGPVDVVVHCAGVLGPLEKLGDAPVDAWTWAFDINLKGTFLVARELARTANGKIATFIHAGTAASFFPAVGQSSYTASKAASNMVMAQLHTGESILYRIDASHMIAPEKMGNNVVGLEYDTLRVFNVHPGMAKSPVLRKELEVYAQDTPELFGSFSIYLAGSSADFLRGRFTAVNWDVDELEMHQDEILEQGLLGAQPFKGNIGPGGHFKQTSSGI